jgi:glutamate-1-semialdehyde 2,1-aminomutase
VGCSAKLPNFSRRRARVGVDRGGRSSLKTQRIAEGIVSRFVERTQGSQDASRRAKGVLPGGDTRTTTYYQPHPAYMVRGKGCYVYDCDGNRYLDMLNNYTSLIHGHAHPPTVRAIQEQAARGTVLGSPCRIAVSHAEVLCQRVPGLDFVRYCNSGTEATLFALRAARAFTGRDAIIKMEGGYHGTHDYAEVSILPNLERNDLPRGHLSSRGVSASVLDEVFVVPVNNLDAVEKVLTEHGDDVAALIIEPLLGAGGGVVAQVDYLRGLRELADQYGFLLVFDEIRTFRLDVGGLQRVHGIAPDITALGKIIGGGLPVGAFGGRAEIMRLFDPTQPGFVKHAGTFNGNSITMAAGLATLGDFGADAVTRLNGLGEKLKHRLNRVLDVTGVRAQVVGVGSLLSLHWQEKEGTTSREVKAAARAAKDVPKFLHLEMLNRGMLCAPRLDFYLSTAMTGAQVDEAAHIFGGALDTLKPYMVEQTPHLVGG